MDAVATLSDNSTDFLEPVLRAVVGFKRAACPKAGPHHDKDDRPKKILILIVERTIDEDVAVLPRHYFLAADARLTSRIALRISFEVKCVAFSFGRMIFTPSPVVPT